MDIKQLQLKRILNIIVLIANKTIWLLYGHHIVFDGIDRPEKGETQIRCLLQKHYIADNPN